MIVFRGCGKCQGDMLVERNIEDADLVCLQCGYRRAINMAQLVRERPESRTLEHAAR